MMRSVLLNANAIFDPCFRCLASQVQLTALCTREDAPVGTKMPCDALLASLDASWRFHRDL